MNLRAFQERTTRSRSPKRYSLNRKIKERERKQVGCRDEFGSRPLVPVSSQAGVREIDGRANELPGYETKRDNEMRNTAISSLLHDGQGLKCNWTTSTPVQGPMMPRSPGDYSRIVSQLDNNIRRQQENQRYVQVPYAHYPINYGSHFGSFQGIQTIQSHNPHQNGVGPQGNPFVQPYMTPIQPGMALHFSQQVTTQRSEVYNACTAYNNPFEIVWRPN